VVRMPEQRVSELSNVRHAEQPDSVDPFQESAAGDKFRRVAVNTEVENTECRDNRR
jgi:hypothetical protein